MNLRRKLKRLFCHHIWEWTVIGHDRTEREYKFVGRCVKCLEEQRITADARQGMQVWDNLYPGDYFGKWTFHGPEAETGTPPQPS